MAKNILLLLILVFLASCSRAKKEEKELAEMILSDNKLDSVQMCLPALS